MKKAALEMEDEEVESFLDSEDEALYDMNGSSSPSSKSSSRSKSSSVVVCAIAALILLALYWSGATTSTIEEEEALNEGVSPSTPSDEHPASAPTTPLPRFYSNMATIVPDPYHVPIDNETKKEIADKWGKWHFWDGEEDGRPTGDYCAAYPNRDIPGDQFPDEAWQVDAVFVNHIIDDADQLIARAKEAIFTEYGKGKPLPPEGLAERLKMFKWEKIDLSTQTQPPPKYGRGRAATRGDGGWTTTRSFDGLVRRILHAIMTNDVFTVVMGGHSAAAGHGNNFHQSYMMQFHQVLAPIFARLGVKLVTRNMAQGGLGTLQASLGFQDIYGDEIDLMLWDSGMTEREGRAVDLFFRQALISGKRVPVLWGRNFEVLRTLHEHADADVGEFGTGMDGIPPTQSDEHAQTLPHCVRYLKCTAEAKDVCAAQTRFCASCWLRDDLNKHELFTHVDPKPGGQVGWHPGWKEHQLTGRVLAFAVLDALQVAVQTWSEGTMGGPPLDDSFWHVTDYYDNIRNKALNLDKSVGKCHEYEDYGVPARVCNTPMKGRTQFTPRVNPELSSLTSIVKEDADGYVPLNQNKMMYEGPEGHNKCYDIPEGEADVYAIVSGRRRLMSLLQAADTNAAHITANTRVADKAGTRRDLASDDIVVGKGWQVHDERPGYCDGSYYTICGRAKDDKCPALGHHDSRGAIAGNEYSGWLVMDLPELKEGLIIVKFHSWLDQKVSTRTQGWTSVNNENRRLKKRSVQLFDEENPLMEETMFDYSETDHHRILADVKNFPDTFEFDFAINGKITTLSKQQFLEQRKNPQRVVELITLLDDPNFTKDPVTVQVAFRMRGCQRMCTFGFTHIYWA